VLSLANILSGANAFEISDIHEDEAAAALTRRSGCNNVTSRWESLDEIFGLRRPA